MDEGADCERLASHSGKLIREPSEEAAADCSPPASDADEHRVDESSSPPVARRKRTLFAVGEKLRMIERIKGGESLRGLQRETGIDRKVLRNWRTGEVRLRQAAAGGNLSFKRVHSGRLWMQPSVCAKRRRRPSVESSDAAPELKMERRTITRALTASGGAAPPVLQRNGVEDGGDGTPAVAAGHIAQAQYVDEDELPDSSYANDADVDDEHYDRAFSTITSGEYERLQLRILDLRAQNLEMDLHLKADEHRLKLLDIKMKEMQVNRMKQEDKRSKLNDLASKLPSNTANAEHSFPAATNVTEANVSATSAGGSHKHSTVHILK